METLTRLAGNVLKDMVTLLGDLAHGAVKYEIVAKEPTDKSRRVTIKTEIDGQTFTGSGKWTFTNLFYKNIFDWS